MLANEFLEEDTSDQKGTLLFVDDEENILKSLTRVFRGSGYKILTANGGKKGLEILENYNIDLIISDMRMPEMDGAEFLEIAAKRWPSTIRMLLTGFSDMTSTVAAINRGAIYKYIDKPWEDNDIRINVQRALEKKYIEQERDQLRQLTEKQNNELKELNATLEQKVKSRTKDLDNALKELEATHESLKRSYTAAVKVFANLIEMRDKIASGHARRVADNAHRIAIALGLKKNETQDVLFAGLLHDIGKIGLSDTVMAKPFHNLDPKDRIQVIKHPVIGQGVLMSLEPLQGAAQIIRHHHEQYNGKGYPDGLSGKGIPLGSRIIAVASDFDALQIGTLWTQRMSKQEAIEYLTRNKGKLYDPQVVETFLNLDGATLSNGSFQRDMPLKTKDVREGMVLSRDLLTDDGVLLLAKGHKLDSSLIDRVQRFEGSLDTEFILYIVQKK